MPQPIDDDSTIKLIKPASSVAPPRRVPPWMFAVPALIVALAVGGGWLLWRSTPPPVAPTAVRADAAGQSVAGAPPSAAPSAALPGPGSPASASSGVPSAGALAPGASRPGAPTVSGAARIAPEGVGITGDRPLIPIETATEQQILDHVPAEGTADPTIFRFRSNPRILVLDFASLLDQGEMLNRIAALSEKSGLPRDRLLSDTELDTAVRAGGDTVETYYYGHDYGVPELVRFFALSDRDDVRLVGGEDNLRRLMHQEGWFQPDARAALISIPQVGANEHVTPVARRTILHHELSHGEYFTNPAYAAFVHRFWTQTLTAAERDRIRLHLRSLGYDPGLEEVMENEAQAYLMFTYSADFFTPDMIGMSKARLGDLRNGFLRTMPAGWLHDSLGQFLSTNKTAVAAHP